MARFEVGRRLAIRAAKLTSADVVPFLNAAFCCLALFASPVMLMRKLVGAVGIGLKPTLKIRKLLILLNAKNAKNTGFAQPRYTPGTRNQNALRRYFRLYPERFRIRDASTAPRHSAEGFRHVL